MSHQKNVKWTWLSRYLLEKFWEKLECKTGTKFWRYQKGDHVNEWMNEKYILVSFTTFMNENSVWNVWKFVWLVWLNDINFTFYIWLLPSFISPLSCLQYSSIPHLQNSVYKYIKALFWQEPSKCNIFSTFVHSESQYYLTSYNETMFSYF